MTSLSPEQLLLEAAMRLFQHVIQQGPAPATENGLTTSWELTEDNTFVCFIETETLCCETRIQVVDPTLLEHTTALTIEETLEMINVTNRITRTGEDIEDTSDEAKDELRSAIELHLLSVRV